MHFDRMYGFGAKLAARTGILLAVAILIAGAVLPSTVAAVQPAQDFPPETGDQAYASGEVLIGWQPDANVIPQGIAPTGLDEGKGSAAWQLAAQAVADRTALEVLDVQPFYGTARLSVPPGQEWAEIKRLSAMPWVAYAEPNYIAHAASYPNDPYIGEQWNLRRIDAPAAWDVTMGSVSIVVAVVDSGVDLAHPEFSGRLLPGYDYVRGDSYPDDEYDHGTHVTGIAAATANNAVGIAGLAPNVKILPLKVLSSSGSGSYYNIGLAIRKAADYGAQVINLSLGGAAASSILEGAVAYATQKGALLVAAAGNCIAGTAECGDPNIRFYPAAYSQSYPGLLAVAASDHFDNWSPYSYHKPYVDLAAPGGLSDDPIWSTVRLASGGYGYEHGTSMATSLVSGAAALTWTFLPTATGAQVAQVLTGTADKVGGYPYVDGRNDYFGYGRLNVARAVRQAYPPSLVPIKDTQSFLLGGSRTTAYVSLALINPSDQIIQWEAAVIQGGQWLSASPSNGATSYSEPASLVLRVGPVAMLPGRYPGLVRVRSVSPVASSFDIPVQLQVAVSLRQSFFPLVAVNSIALNWVEPTSDAQALNLTDNSARQLSLPFAVTFYGRSFNTLWVSDNGIVTFGQPYAGQTYNPADCIPSAATPNDAIYVLWQDWNPSLGGQVYVQRPDADRYVITWYQVRREGSSVAHSFQVVFRRNGEILLQYRTVQEPVRATIGAENYDGTVAQTLLCDGVGRQVTSGDAVLLSPDLPW